MDTLSFLQHVLPTEGLYVTTVINGGAPQQAFFNTVGELASNCERSDRFGNNTYFAISSFKVRGSRKQDNVHLTKVVALDVDCAKDKPYLNQKEGLAALLKFLTDTGLPKPMIISSGRGLHVYWVLDDALPPAEWKPLAEAMKQAVVAHDFRIDNGLTANSSLVLRPTGTHNPKNGAEVKLLMAANVTDKHTLENVLQNFKQTNTPNLSTPLSPPTPAKSGLAAALAVNQEFPPAVSSVVEQKCQQIKWAVANQAKVPEPLWYDLIGVAAYCVDPEGTAKAWSNQHPNYSEAETLRKLKQWKSQATGPATCNKFVTDRPKGCANCKVRGDVTTPAMIGVYYAATSISEDAPDKIASVIPMPRPFKFSDIKQRDGTFVKKMVKTIDGTDIIVCPFEIYPTGYGRDESLGYETVRYKWRRAHVGWQDLTFRQAYLNDGSREFPTTIADQGIVLHGDKQVKGFQYMLRAYMDELRTLKSMTNIHGSMGWKDNFKQFVVGDRLYRREGDGSVTVDSVSLSASSNRLGHELYGHSGSVEEWSKATALLETADMPHHIFALGHAFSSPLWALTGLKGITVSLYGPTGGGKSLIQLWQQSVWGSPERLHFTAKFTQNSLFSRLGLYCHLPMTIDEATMMDDKEVGDFCYWVTQGRDKARLNRQAEERNAKEWATTVTVSTNRSFISKMVASGLDTDAQMARLLEVTIPPHPLFDKSSNAGRKIFNFLSTNYGVVGDVFVKALLRLGKEELLCRIAATTAIFSKLYNCHFAGAERYWEQDLILIHVAYQIAHEEGLISFDYTLGIKWAIAHLDALRHSVQDNQTDGFKIVHEYLNENASDVLVVMHTDGQPSTIDQTRVPRGEVKARFDVYRKNVGDPFDRGTVMLVQKSFKKAVSARGYDYNTLRKEVQDEGIDATPQTKRAWIGRDTALKLGQQYVFGINLNHPYMLGYLEDIELAAADMSLGQMGVVN